MQKTRLTPLLLMLFAAAPAQAANDPAPLQQTSKVETRRRLAACATEWQRMKRSGTDGALIWREFSSACMARSKP